MMRSKILFFIQTILYTFIAIQTYASPTLNARETKISQYITAAQKSQVHLLKRLVNINSGTSNPHGVKRVGTILQKEFQKLGFHTFWVEEPVSMHRGPTLVAEHKGKTSGKRLLLIGHLDTVFARNSSFQTFKQKDGTAMGPGVVDDKGGDVVILFALKALKAAQLLNQMTVRVVLTGDEEDSGKPASISRKPLFDAAKRSDVALDFECAITKGTASIARRGISNWRISTEGKEAHSSEIFRRGVGDGAIFEMARLLDAIRKELSIQKDLSFNPGLILGGTRVHEDHLKHDGTAFGKENVVAKTAVASGDLRYISSAQKESAKNQIRHLLNQHLPGTKASVEFEDGIPAMSVSAGNQALLEAYSQVSEALGYGTIQALDAGARGAGDISYVANMVAQNLVGLGPIGTGLHSSEETLQLSSLVMQTQRAALLMYRMSYK